MSGLARDGTAGPVSREQIFRRERGQGENDFPGSADHEQDWQPYSIDPYSGEVNVLIIRIAEGCIPNPNYTEAK